MSYNLVNSLVTVFFAINGLLHLDYSYRLKKLFKKEHDFKTSVATSVLWIVAGIVYPLLYNNPGLELISSAIIVLLVPFIVMFALLTQLGNKRDSVSSYREFISNYVESKSKLRILRWDVNRKFFHIIPVLLIFLIVILIDSNIHLIITVGYAGIVLFGALDFIRFSFVYKNRGVNHLIPKGVIKSLSGLIKRKELFEPLKTVPLILGITPALFLPFNLFIAVALVATISDGVASVMGHAFGKIKSSRNGKTGSGYLGGVIASFVLVITSCLLINPVFSFNKSVFIAFAGAFAFFMGDLLNWGIDDNVVNPLLTTLTISIAFLFF